MTRFLLVIAVLHDGGPYLVTDAHAQRLNRYVGVRHAPKPVGKHPHLAAHYKAEEQVVEDHPHYRKEATAGTLRILAEVDADTHEAAGPLLAALATKAPAPAAEEEPEPDPVTETR